MRKVTIFSTTKSYAFDTLVLEKEINDWFIAHEGSITDIQFCQSQSNTTLIISIFYRDIPKFPVPLRPTGPFEPSMMDLTQGPGF